MLKCRFVAALVLFASATTTLQAAERSLYESDRPAPTDAFKLDEEADADVERSDIIVPLLSFAVPGLGQLGAGQYGYAGLYFGTAVAGYAYSLGIMQAHEIDSLGNSTREEDKDKSDDQDEKKSIDSKDDRVRKISLGMQVAQAAGGLSAYHTFRTSVRTRQVHGKYKFLTYEESPADVMLAPFHFQYLARPTTYIPLLIGAGLAAYVMNASPGDDYVRTTFTGSDGFFTGAFSYNAGTHEEAVFRGWIMPVMNEYWHSELWANVGQATLFGLAHLNTVSVPIAQLALGYHLGNVTQQRGWLIGESVFIHVWWDVLAFASLYHYREKLPEEKKQNMIRPVFWLPPLEYAF